MTYHPEIMPVTAFVSTAKNNIIHFSGQVFSLRVKT